MQTWSPSIRVRLLDLKSEVFVCVCVTSRSIFSSRCFYLYASVSYGVLHLINSCWWICTPFHRIQDLVKGGAQLPRPKVADIAEQSHMSEVTNLWPGSRACLRAMEAFGFLMLKYIFSHILETLFLLFLTSTLTPKADKNRILDCTAINMKYSCILHLVA